MNTLVQGAWILLLSRYTREQEIVMGVTSSARPTSLPGIETVVGLISNTIPLRINVTPDVPLLTWLSDLQAHQVDLRQHEYQPWQQVQAWSEIPLDRQLFESYLVFENYPWDNTILSIENLNIDITHPLSQKDYTVLQTEFPLRLDAVPGADLTLAMSYYRTYFDDNTITSMLSDWQAEIERMVQFPRQKLADFLTETE
jgi:non-ribosomal peptide synthetase component F